MDRRVLMSEVAIALVETGWAAAKPKSAPDFELVVDALAGPTTSLADCDLAWVNPTISTCRHIGLHSRTVR